MDGREAESDSIKERAERRGQKREKAGKTVGAASRFYSGLNQRFKRRVGSPIAKTEAAICSGTRLNLSYTPPKFDR